MVAVEKTLSKIPATLPNDTSASSPLTENDIRVGAHAKGLVAERETLAAGATLTPEARTLAHAQGIATENKALAELQRNNPTTAAREALASLAARVAKQSK